MDREAASAPAQMWLDFAAPAGRVRPGNLAYVLYISGSTGRPKGVEIGHRGVVNVLRSVQERLGMRAGESLLAVTKLSTVFESFQQEDEAIRSFS